MVTEARDKTLHQSVDRDALYVALGSVLANEVENAQLVALHLNPWVLFARFQIVVFELVLVVTRVLFLDLAHEVTFVPDLWPLGYCSQKVGHLPQPSKHLFPPTHVLTMDQDDSRS